MAEETETPEEKEKGLGAGESKLVKKAEGIEKTGK